LVCRNRENQHISEEELDVLREILRRKKKRDLKAVEEEGGKVKMEKRLKI
jgi:hypothetical protein